MELILTAANVLYLVAYVVRDMLVLRVLSVIAAACLAAHFAMRPEPLVLAVSWNVVFVVLNACWAVRLSRSRRVRGQPTSSIGGAGVEHTLPRLPLAAIVRTPLSARRP